METGPVRRGVAMARCVGVTVSVLTWLALSYIVWCTRGHGEHPFRRPGFPLGWGFGMGRQRVFPFSVEDAGQKRDDSADEDEGNGRCEQATNPYADGSHLRWRPATVGESMLRLPTSGRFIPRQLRPYVS